MVRGNVVKQADRKVEMARRRRNRARLEGERKALHLLPWRRVRNRFPPIEPLSEDQIEAIHRNLAPGFSTNSV